MAEAGEFLRVSDLHAWYGESHILHGVDLTVHEGEVVTLLGRNGAGRTTTIKSILGLVGRRTGSIRIQGVESVAMPPHQIAKLGIGYCPEERGIFASLSCEENLLLPPVLAEGGMGLDEIYEMFPNLLERRNSPGTRLSGGEQQMLAVGRILRTGAKMLLLDEISEGLAPVMVQHLEEIVAELGKTGLGILLVEQNLYSALSVANEVYLMETGEIVHHCQASELMNDRETMQRFLGVR